MSTTRRCLSPCWAVATAWPRLALTPRRWAAAPTAPPSCCWRRTWFYAQCDRMCIQLAAHVLLQPRVLLLLRAARLCASGCCLRWLNEWRELRRLRERLHRGLMGNRLRRGLVSDRLRRGLRRDRLHRRLRRDRLYRRLRREELRGRFGWLARQRVLQHGRRGHHLARGRGADVRGGHVHQWR